jgi:hypothetical protein
MRREPRGVEAIKEHPAAASGRQARQRATEGRLACPIPAEHRSHRAALGSERESLQHVAVAVVGVDVGQIEHG